MASRARRCLLCIISFLALFSAQCSRPAPASSPSADCPVLKKGLAFLQARYNPDLGLLNEAPNAAPHTYWLTNDNALAAYAFEQLGQKEMSARLRTALQRNGRESSGLIEVLWGKVVTFPPYTTTKKVVARVGEDEIWQELHTSGARFKDWADYADLGFYGALNAYQQGGSTEALNTYAWILTLFDGTGFKDKAFNGSYETFKLALGLYVGKAIQAPIPQADRLRETLRAMQAADGGFATHYKDPRTPVGDTNTETTSLALLALVDDCK